MLQVRRLEKIIENRSVLFIEQLDIAGGEVVAVIGPQHSGKTLLIKLLAGILLPSGGTILLDGKDVHYDAATRSRINILFEEDLLYERHNARKNLEFYRHLHGLPRQSINEALAHLGLSDQASRPVSKLAPSIQRRVAFARLMMRHSPLILLDEPIARTDLDTQEVFARLITQAAQNGSAVLLTGKDIYWTGKCCTRVIELEDGRIVSNQQVNIKQEDQPVVPNTSERLVPYKVPARKEDRIVLFDPNELLYATSRDGKTILRTASEEATTNLTLQELETRLTGRGFFKAHRAYLVNLQHIKAVIQYTRNSYTLLLNDKQETMIPLSKQSEKELQELLGY